MNNQNFVHLRTKSDYSLLSSTLKVKKIASLSAQHGFNAVGLADLNNLFGVLEFSNACKSNNIQPIISAEFELSFSLPNSELGAKEVVAKIMLVATSEIGYQNLLSISQRVSSGLFEKNYLNYDFLLKDYNQDLICILSYETGVIDQYFKLHAGMAKLPQDENDYRLLYQYAQNQYEINHILENLKLIFNQDRLYLEICRHGYEYEQLLEIVTIFFANLHNLPLVATNNILYPRAQDQRAHDALICIRDGFYMSDFERKKFTQEHYFKSAQEMLELFSDLPDAIENTVQIALRCHFCPASRPPSLPKFSDDEVFLLRKMSDEGLEQKLKKNLVSSEQYAEYRQRLQFELETICKMGYAGYFLIVADFINYAKTQEIYVGPGRGSAAGSLVAWVLGITDVNPLGFGLLFERFLNPERISMPDIDIDFCPEGRDQVVEYIKQKYGHDHVANIITFGALQAKGVLRDTGRVLGMPYSKVDAICKMIPFNPTAPISLQEAIDLDANLRNQAAEDESVADLLEIGLQLEGILRNQSTHAAGIVISDKPLHELIPVCYDQETGALITGFHMKPLEQSGLVKFDFLGLSTLTLIQKILKLINARHRRFLSIEDIDLFDAKTYKMLCTGQAIGIFQLESGIMRDGLKRIQPSCIEDLIALVSLNRPGPMENVPEYIARKFGQKEIDYLHPSLRQLLHETFGIIVYQEQVMEIAKILAGYSLAEADLLRRAMGKKIKEEMDQQKEFFIEGAKKNGLSSEKASFIFDLVAKFAGYGFNKSHATAYAIISYYTAWLKTHYPLEFFTALFNLEIQNTDKLAIIKADANFHGIKILPPCVVKSSDQFNIEGDAIRYGLHAVKNVGSIVSIEIAHNREKNGCFKDLFDFLSRFNSKVLNKKSLESLIKAGALDCFLKIIDIEYNRISFLSAVPNMISFIGQGDKNQLNLFDFSEENSINFFNIEKLSDEPESVKIQNEYEALGFYLNKNPVQFFESFLLKKNVVRCADVGGLGNGQVINLSGVISTLRIRSSKRGKFANLTIMDHTGLAELFIYNSEMIAEKTDILKEGKLIFCTVKGLADKNASSSSETSNSVRLIINDFDDLSVIAKAEKSIYELELNQSVNLDLLSGLMGEKKNISDMQNQNDPSICFTYNTYYILKIYMTDYVVELKPKLVFCSPDSERLQKIKDLPGVINIRKI